VPLRLSWSSLGRGGRADILGNVREEARVKAFTSEKGELAEGKVAGTTVKRSRKDRFESSLTLVK
jgi:hypothetical protein